MTRGAFTIAVGKPLFIEMAVALARSFLRWNAGNGIGFTIFTDRPKSQRPTDLGGIDWVEIRTNQFGTGFVPKLHLDRLAPYEKSLFIDADCLCVRSLASTFEVFSGRSVSVIGRSIHDGEWFGDTSAILRRLGLVEMPRFNGGLYYLEPGKAASAVFETARGLLPDYDRLGFIRLRDRENEEVLISAAMATHGLEPVAEDGTIMNSAVEAPGGIFIDVIRGRSLMLNPVSHPRHFSCLSLEVMKPAIVHFCGSNADEHPYRTEIEALERVARGWPPNIARLYADSCFGAPFIARRAIKNLLRPSYHALFGARPVRRSARL